MRAEKSECLFFLSKKLFITFISIFAIHAGQALNDGFFATNIAPVTAGMGVFGVDRTRFGRRCRLQGPTGF